MSPPSGSLNVSLSYDPTSHTLTCVSSGGPVNTVTWTRNGADISSSPYQLRQSLENGTTSTYHNLLTINNSGIYTCTVKNGRGMASSSLNLNCMLIP